MPTCQMARITSAHRTFIIRTFTATELQIVADAVDRREPAQLAKRFLGEADMVLAEGFSLTPGDTASILSRCDGVVPEPTSAARRRPEGLSRDHYDPGQEGGRSNPGG